MSQDIIRRILQDYFKYDINFVMNITDVDDKIILAARRQYLFAQWLEKHKASNAEVRDTTTKARKKYTEKNLPRMNADRAPEDFEAEADQAYGHVLHGKSEADDGSPPGDKEAKIKMHLNTARAAANAEQASDLTPEQYANQSSGVLLPYIDSLYASTVDGKNHEIFTALTKHYESEFFTDMRALNIRYPDQLVRVTEYGPQIVEFVKKIVDNGFAYEHEGSIYYDVNAWESKGGSYARLEPWNRNDQDLQADGEGSLVNKNTAFKHSSADFALWKASKQGEPSWSSPWGEGRPGWHIECSAMASNILGKQFDLHSGGIDLAFPHHDNELAQSEAYWCDHGDPKSAPQWVGARDA
jgi:cysteinyl-tRNA synthetase